MTFPQEQASAMRSALLNWYDHNARELPWRREPSLYKTVVSEFMLQQTQVKTALPYFHAWLRDYPDFQALAKASEQQILKSWEGLGYYARARNLAKLAKTLAKLPEESYPKTAPQWQELPGIGAYAAAAIASIACGDIAAVVDGNVVRILTRLTCDQRKFKNSTDAAKRYRSVARELLDPIRSGDYNQAIMELGATVCHKRSPSCLLCPIAAHCKARVDGLAETLPKFEKTRYESIELTRVWILGEHGLLLHKIPDSAKRMKGLHELPDPRDLSIKVEAGSRAIATKKRGITRYRITEKIHEVSAHALPNPLPAGHAWHDPAQLQQVPMSGPHRRWISELLGKFQECPQDQPRSSRNH